MASALASCSGPTDTNGPAASIQPVGGTAVSVPVASTAPTAISLRVLDAAGRGVPGAEVTWFHAGTGAVSLSHAASVTDRQGLATTAFTTGTTAGSAIVRASTAAGGQPIYVDFSLSVTPGPIAALQAPSAVTMGAGTTRAIVVGATDAYGNAIPGPAALTWTTSAADVAEASGPGMVTGKDLGGARITARAGSLTAEFDVWVVPTSIYSCERNTGVVCGSWVLETDHYRVSWSDNVTSRIDVAGFSDSGMDFRRTDLSGNQNFTARYVGTKSGRTAAGPVTWTQNGFSWSGTWTAEW